MQFLTFMWSTQNRPQDLLKPFEPRSFERYLGGHNQRTPTTLSTSICTTETGVARPLVFSFEFHSRPGGSEVSEEIEDRGQLQGTEHRRREVRDGGDSVPEEETQS